MNTMLFHDLRALFISSRLRCRWFIDASNCHMMAKDYKTVKGLKIIGVKTGKVQIPTDHVNGGFDLSVVDD